MQTAELPSTDELKRVGRRFGFGVAIVINLVMLYIVQNLTSWDVLPFLTKEFDSLVPWISVSLIVTIVANFLYMVNDGPRLRGLGDMVTSLVSLAVTWRVLAVFPFDFSAYDFDWELVARFVLVLAIVGTFAAAVAGAVKLATGQRQPRKRRSHVGAV
ncbi:MAG: hypothetical protein WCE80_06545 [Acidimicrobiia bacterium]